MSEDEITKESVIVQIKAERWEALCCGTVYYTKHHIQWFGFWVWPCNPMAWSLKWALFIDFALLTCT